jgi:hypothetical protein
MNTGKITAMGISRYVNINVTTTVIEGIKFACGK